MFKNRLKQKNMESPSNDGEISFIIPELSKQESLFEVKKSSECVPEWWKDLPNTWKSKQYEKDLTLKACIPFTDVIMSGYMLVLKEDIFVKYNEETKKTEISSDFPFLKNNFSYHSTGQAPTMPIAKEYVDDLIFKWVSSYIVKTPKNYSILFTHPLNHPSLPFYTLSAIVDTDKYFMPVNFPFLMKNNYNGVIPKGTPIVQIIPFKRDKWDFKEFSNVGESFVFQQEVLRQKYHGERQIKDGKMIGGVYKRKYRVRKEY
jgi:hypothetical protein